MLWVFPAVAQWRRSMAVRRGAAVPCAKRKTCRPPRRRDAPGDRAPPTRKSELAGKKSMWTVSLHTSFWGHIHILEWKSRWMKSGERRQRGHRRLTMSYTEGFIAIWRWHLSLIVFLEKGSHKVQFTSCVFYKCPITIVLFKCTDQYTETGLVYWVRVISSVSRQRGLTWSFLILSIWNSCVTAGCLCLQIVCLFVDWNLWVRDVKFGRPVHQISASPPNMHPWAPAFPALTKWVSLFIVICVLLT